MLGPDLEIRGGASHPDPLIRGGGERAPPPFSLPGSATEYKVERLIVC